MKAKRFWLASVLLATSAITSGSARADEIAPVESSTGTCASCADGSKFHIGSRLSLFHQEHKLIDWQPGQVIGSVHDKASSCIHSIADCFHSKTPPDLGHALKERQAMQAYQQQQTMYLYNPYIRSPRDYFMSDH